MLALELRIKSYFLSALVGLVCTTSIGIFSHAENSRIENAVGLRITARGQNLFNSNLRQLMFLNGVQVDSLYLKDIQFTQQKPMALTPALKEYLDIINLGTLGVDLKPSQIHMQVQDFEANVHFTDLSLQFFPTQLNLAEGGGAASVMARLHAKISTLRTDILSIRADDLANPFLGMFGFNNFSLYSKPKTPALEIAVPLIITVQKGRDDVGLSVGTITSSLAKFSLAYDFAHPAVLPDIDININGSHMRLDKNYVSKELLTKQERLLHFVKNELDAFIRRDLPTKINELLQKKVFKKFSEINLLAPIGGNLEHNGVIHNPLQPDDLFQWKISLDELRLDQKDLVASVSASVRDPRSQTAIQLPPEATSKNNPAHELQQYPSDQYDAAISLNQGFLNRFLVLSFNRGYFENIPYGEAGVKTQFLHISKSPLVRFDLSPEAGDIVRVQIEVRPEVTGLEKVAVNSDFRVNITANMKIVPTEKGYGLVVDSLDEKFTFDKKALRLDIFKSRVEKGILEQIRTVNALKSKPVISDQIPVPKSLFGVPAVLKHMSPSKTGFINFYYEYGDLQ